MNGTDADIVTALVDGIGQLLAGHDPATQGVALADCLARWLAGHVASDEDATRVLRAEILAYHCVVVRELVPLAAEVIGTTP